MTPATDRAGVILGSIGRPFDLDGVTLLVEIDVVVRVAESREEVDVALLRDDEASDGDAVALLRAEAGFEVERTVVEAVTMVGLAFCMSLSRSGFGEGLGVDARG